MMCSIEAFSFQNSSKRKSILNMVQHAMRIDIIQKKKKKTKENKPCKRTRGAQERSAC